VPDCEVLAALVPERVLPFASGDSRKRGPGRVGFPAHDRGGAPKGERSRLSGRGCACIEAQQLELVRRSALRLPLGGAKTSPPVRSRQAFLESVKEDPDANSIAGMQFRVVIAGLAVVTRP